MGRTDSSADFSNPYYSTISKEENHTRRHCWICGWSNIPRYKLEICDLCGNVCSKCKEFHDKAGDFLHKREKYTLKVISDKEALSNVGDKLKEHRGRPAQPIDVEQERDESPKRPKFKQTTLMGFQRAKAKSAKPAITPRT